VNDNIIMAPDAERSVDLPTLWRIAWNYKFFICGIALLFAAIAAVFALLATPMYRASAIITPVEDHNLGGGGAFLNQLGGLASLAGMDVAGTASMRDAKALLESRNLIEEFIQRNKLQTVLARHGKPLTLWKAVDAFEKEVVSIEDDPRKGKTTVTMEWTDPRVAAQWANSFVALANDMVRARAQVNSQRNIDYLNKQLAQTTVVELQKVMYNIIEQETKTLMLANAQPEYAFAVIDPAVTPEERFKPKRTLMVIIGFLLGGFVGVFAAFAHAALRREKRQVSPGI
jgi:uncharacterized protein involved in exopolysaccharide biosynthesis